MSDISQEDKELIDDGIDVLEAHRLNPDDPNTYDDLLKFAERLDASEKNTEATNNLRDHLKKTHLAPLVVAQEEKERKRKKWIKRLLFRQSSGSKK